MWATDGALQMYVKAAHTEVKRMSVIILGFLPEYYIIDFDCFLSWDGGGGGGEEVSHSSLRNVNGFYWNSRMMVMKMTF